MSIVYGDREFTAEEWNNRPADDEILHPDGSDCDYCTYTAPCITVVNMKRPTTWP